MSNFQKPKKQFEYPSDFIEQFLSAHDFVGTEIDYINGVTILKNNKKKRYVKVPTKRILNSVQIEECLIDAGLTLSDLDNYTEHLKALGEFDDLIDYSLSRASAKN